MSLILSEILERLYQSTETIKQRVEELHDNMGKVPTLRISWADKLQLILLTSVITLVMLYLFRKY